MSEPVLRLRFDVPIAVIGDIHGTSAQLRALLARLPKDMPVLVVGDLCDRGPDTRGVLDQLVARGARGVLGNHDEWLLAWARGEGFDRAALSPMMSGEATLQSYGVEGGRRGRSRPSGWRLPAEHAAFLEGLASVIDLDVMGQRYWVTHAGVPSSEPLDGLRMEEAVPHLARTKPAVLRWPSTDPEMMLPLDRTVVMGMSLNGGRRTPVICWPSIRAQGRAPRGS